MFPANQYSFLLFLVSITHTHTCTLTSFVCQRMQGSCYLTLDGENRLLWWISCSRCPMDYYLISALGKSNQMVAVGICLIKTPDVDNVSPWPLIYNDLHTAAKKKKSNPTTLWLSLGIILYSLCVLYTVLMAWLTYFSSVKLNQLNKIYSHLFSHFSVKSAVIC